MPDLDAVYELRKMLREMERDIGIDTLSETERDVFLAARNLSDSPGDFVESDAIRNHDLVRSTAQATFHRTLRALIDLGLLKRANGFKTKRYVVRSDLVAAASRGQGDGTD
ncbi:hypothetical protein [Tranquillimonas rosea]|uniref:hypothetical protein n=1 Tax=Tranquillimonas rosea TaxID=641238 RepID=UPI003BA8AE6D